MEEAIDPPAKLGNLGRVAQLAIGEVTLEPLGNRSGPGREQNPLDLRSAPGLSPEEPHRAEGSLREEGALRSVASCHTSPLPRRV
jgi:hypothetical protein